MGNEEGKFMTQPKFLKLGINYPNEKKCRCPHCWGWFWATIMMSLLALWLAFVANQSFKNERTLSRQLEELRIKK